MAAQRDPKQNTASAVVDDDEPDEWYIPPFLDPLVQLEMLNKRLQGQAYLQHWLLW